MMKARASDILWVLWRFPITWQLFGGKRYLFQVSAYEFPLSSRFIQLLASLPSPQPPSRLPIWMGASLKLTRCSCFSLSPGHLESFLPCQTLRVQAVPRQLSQFPPGFSFPGRRQMMVTMILKLKDNKFKLSNVVSLGFLSLA